MTTSVLALLPELVLLFGAVGCLLLGSWTPRLRQRRVRAVAALTVLVFLAAAVRGLLSGATTAFSGTFAVDETTGLLRLVVGFLLASIPLYGLIGLSAAATAPEAALKTYLVGALSGIVLMLGAGVLFGLAGTTAYADLGAGVRDAPAAAGAAGVVLVVFGLLFKAGAVPAHFWVPDAVQGSWVTSAAFLTTVPKLGAVVAVMRLLEALPRQDVWPLLVAALAALGMTAGNLAALTQGDVRRLLGWSTISQVGYLLAVVAAVPSVERARPAVLLFLAGYAVTNLACFAVLRAEPERVRVDQWRGVARRRPGLAVALGVALLGLVGTPPTAVFVAKVATIAVTWEAGLAWLAVLVAANTVLSLAYYLRWLATCLATADQDEDEDSTTTRRLPAALAMTCAAGAVALGLVAGPVLALG